MKVFAIISSLIAVVCIGIIIFCFGELPKIKTELAWSKAECKSQKEALVDSKVAYNALTLDKKVLEEELRILSTKPFPNVVHDTLTIFKTSLKSKVIDSVFQKNQIKVNDRDILTNEYNNETGRRTIIFVSGIPNGITDVKEMVLYSPKNKKPISCTLKKVDGKCCYKLSLTPGQIAITPATGGNEGTSDDFDKYSVPFYVKNKVTKKMVSFGKNPIGTTYRIYFEEGFTWYGNDIGYAEASKKYSMLANFPD